MLAKPEEGAMEELEGLIEPEWLDWYRLTPQQRFAESERLWVSYLAMGGSFDPEPDSHSPFYDSEAPCQVPADGGPGVRVLRRGGV
jgi:hypothetical protein